MAIHGNISQPSSVRNRLLRGLSARSMLDQAWSHPAARTAVAVTLAGASGLIMALLMPRGPVTTSDALLLMMTGLITGLVTSYTLASRWAMAIAPVVHMMVFELGRTDEIGPTVGSMDFDNSFAVLAIVLGRGVYVVLGLFPMIMGAAYGAGLSRWQSHSANESSDRNVPSKVRRAIGAIATFSLLGMAIRIAQPARVAPVTDAGGNDIKGSISELQEINIGGHNQWIQIRGASQNLPVLLYLSGGPGQSDLAFSRVLLDEFTRDFLVVGWDQRGNGKSYPDLDPESLTLEQAVADTIELTDFLCDRFGEEGIYILGESWGTTLGVLAMQQAPERYLGYIGSGQMVSQRVTDQIIYDDLLAWADTNGDDDLANTLRESGPPPYDSLWMYAEVMMHYDKLTPDYDPPQAYIDRAKAGNVGPWGLRGAEYTAMDKVNVLRGLIDTFDVMYPQLQEIDFRNDVPELDVPVYLVMGENELRGRLELAEEWFSLLKAPHKELHIFENAGHSAAFEQADEVHRMLLDEILPTTYPTKG